MKVVINTCFGGYELSAKAIKRLAELKGRQAFFFKREGSDVYGPLIPISVEDADKEWIFSAYDIPNPDDVLPCQRRWGSMSQEDRVASSRLHEQHNLKSRPEPRNDPDLVRVVEELGGGHRTGASGRFAELKVVEIPDDVEWSIEEYDGNEHIAELHRTWE